MLSEFQRIPTRIDVQKTWKNSSMKLLDVIVDTVFKFEEQSYLENQVNFQSNFFVKFACLYIKIELQLILCLKILRLN